jgi:hypothetical protein
MKNTTKHLSVTLITSLALSYGFITASANTQPTSVSSVSQTNNHVAKDYYRTYIQANSAKIMKSGNNKYILSINTAKPYKLSLHNPRTKESNQIMKPYDALTIGKFKYETNAVLTSNHLAMPIVINEGNITKNSINFEFEPMYNTTTKAHQYIKTGTVNNILIYFKNSNCENMALLSKQYMATFCSK